MTPGPEMRNRGRLGPKNNKFVSYSVLLLPQRRIVGRCWLVTVYMNGAGVRVCIKVIFASGTNTFALLRICVYRVAGRLCARFCDHLHIEDVTLNDRRTTIEAAIEHAIFQHLVKSAKGAAIVTVIVKHLLF